MDLPGLIFNETSVGFPPPLLIPSSARSEDACRLLCLCVALPVAHKAINIAAATRFATRLTISPFALVSLSLLLTSSLVPSRRLCSSPSLSWILRADSRIDEVLVSVGVKSQCAKTERADGENVSRTLHVGD